MTDDSSPECYPPPPQVQTQLVLPSQQPPLPTQPPLPAQPRNPNQPRFAGVQRTVTASSADREDSEAVSSQPTPAAAQLPMGKGHSLQLSQGGALPSFKASASPLILPTIVGTAVVDINPRGALGPGGHSVGGPSTSLAHQPNMQLNSSPSVEPRGLFNTSMAGGGLGISGGGPNGGGGGGPSGGEFGLTGLKASCGSLPGGLPGTGGRQSSDGPVGTAHHPGAQFGTFGSDPDLGIPASGAQSHHNPQSHHAGGLGSASLLSGLNSFNQQGASAVSR